MVGIRLELLGAVFVECSNYPKVTMAVRDAMRSYFVMLPCDAACEFSIWSDIMWRWNVMLASDISMWRCDVTLPCNSAMWRSHLERPCVAAMWRWLFGSAMWRWSYGSVLWPAMWRRHVSLPCDAGMWLRLMMLVMLKCHVALPCEAGMRRWHVTRRLSLLPVRLSAGHKPHPPIQG